MEHLQRVWLPSREGLPFRTPGSVPLLGTCLCSNCWDQIPRTCHVFTRLFALNTPWYFLDFAFDLPLCHFRAFVMQMRQPSSLFSCFAFNAYSVDKYFKIVFPSKQESYIYYQLSQNLGGYMCYHLKTTKSTYAWYLIEKRINTFQSFKNWMLILVMLWEHERLRWDASRYTKACSLAKRFYVYRDASRLWTEVERP